MEAKGRQAYPDGVGRRGGWGGRSWRAGAAVGRRAVAGRPAGAGQHPEPAVRAGPGAVRQPVWWLRAATLPLLGLAPLMLAGLLIATPGVARVSDRSGAAGVAVASYLSMTLVWVLTWLPLTWTFRVVAPARPRWR